MVKNQSNASTTIQSSYLLDTLIVLLLYPLSSTTILSRSLRPLFSSSPVETSSIVFHAFITLMAVSLYLLVPGLRELRKKTLLLILGWNLIIAEGVVRVGASSFLQLGVLKGLYTARLALEGLPMLLKWLLLFNTLEKKYMLTLCNLLPLLFLPLIGIDPFSRFNFLQLIPECYIYQAHGLTFVSLALIYPFSPPSISSRRATTSKTVPTSFPLQSVNLALLTLILIFLTSFTTIHCPTSSLRPENLPLFVPVSRGNNKTTGLSHKILASELGVTGWISVGEQEVNSPGSKGDVEGEGSKERLSQTFRYLRSEHSLLGGLWTGPSREIIVERMLEEGVSPFTEIDENEVVRTAETIYSTFVLQEIIRLAKLKTRETEKGLIIGLGVGISARALLSHGIDITIVEIDKVVYNFAVKYFGVPKLPTSRIFIQDARKFLDADKEVYDYIIHDVFTGGAVPPHLFTQEFWKSTRNRLKPLGILAINFAGTISSTSRSSNLVIATILSSFPYCRAFEDGLPSSDYRNLVFLCSATNPIRFRALLAEDYLPFPSPSVRRRVLQTFKDFEFDLKEVRMRLDRGGGEILKDENVGDLEIAQRSGVIEHWHMMSQTLPDTSWAMY